MKSYSKAEHYEEISLLGDGAFGVVTKCRDKETGQIVALKKMKIQFNSWEDCLKLKEYQSLNVIKNPNVINLYKIFRDGNTFYMVFEYLSGGPLAKTIQTHKGPFSEPEIRFIMRQLLSGIAACHRKGFFHRDIKPENLLWEKDCLKVCDFGLAKEIRSQPPYTEYISTRWYRAPEIVLRHPFYNFPVDIWAAGAIMGELFTLKPLFTGSSETDQIFKIFSCLGTPNSNNWPEGLQLANKLGIKLPQFTATPFSKLIPNASKESLDLLTKMLSLDPKKRPSASQALQHPFFNGEEIPPNNLVLNKIQENFSEIKKKEKKIEKEIENDVEPLSIIPLEPESNDDEKQPAFREVFGDFNSSDGIDDLLDGL